MLKTLARELNLPILCLSQLWCKVEERQGHRPMMSDLRESGAIEQDSDIVMFLLRREYYDPYDKPGMAELIVAKNRHGGLGSVNLTFRKELAQFANYWGMPSSGNLDDNQAAFSAFSPSWFQQLTPFWACIHHLRNQLSSSLFSMARWLPCHCATTE